MRVPLAWRNLTSDKRRLALSLAGIAFVVLLMFMEIGFLNGFMDTTVAVYKRFDADLVMISKRRTPVYPDRFALGRLTQIASHPAVADAFPVYVNGGGSWRATGSPEPRGLRVFAFDTTRRAFRGRDADPDLARPGAVIFDSLSRDLYGQPAVGTRAELNGRVVRVVKVAPIGIDLETDGNVVMGLSTFFGIYAPTDAGGITPQTVDFGLIRLKPGSDPRRVRDELRAHLTADVEVMTTGEYVDGVLAYWNENGAVAFLFQFGVFMGLIIGVIVCYQILFTDITANRMAFATLKAMGYQNRYLIGVVLRQAGLVAVLGFGAGLAGSVVLYRVLHWETGLIMDLTPARAGGIFALTLGMCLIAGLIAVRKIVAADPADCF
ncbi:MAG: ABC transporter permease [Fimbriiglobus sp.]